MCRSQGGREGGSDKGTYRAIRWQLTMMLVVMTIYIYIYVLPPHHTCIYIRMYIVCKYEDNDAIMISHGPKIILSSDSCCQLKLPVQQFQKYDSWQKKQSGQIWFHPRYQSLSSQALSSSMQCNVTIPSLPIWQNLGEKLLVSRMLIMVVIGAPEIEQSWRRGKFQLTPSRVKYSFPYDLGFMGINGFLWNSQDPFGLFGILTSFCDDSVVLLQSVVTSEMISLQKCLQKVYKNDCQLYVWLDRVGFWKTSGQERLNTMWAWQGLVRGPNLNRPATIFQHWSE